MPQPQPQPQPHQLALPLSPPVVHRYAGVGSRQTPPQVLALMTGIAIKLSRKGWVLRSGGAIGADKAFELGSRANSGPTPEIFRPEDATPAAENLAARLHPNWSACKPYVRKLHARNGQIVLGRDVDSPRLIEAMILWAPRADNWTPEQPLVTGGTGQAVRVALASGLPPKRIYNLAATETREWFHRWLLAADDKGGL